MIVCNTIRHLRAGQSQPALQFQGSGTTGREYHDESDKRNYARRSEHSFKAEG